MMVCANCGQLFNSRLVLGWDKNYCMPKCEKADIRKRLYVNRFWERKRHPTIEGE